jgi:hypothetical protein
MGGTTVFPERKYTPSTTHTHTHTHTKTRTKNWGRNRLISYPWNEWINDPKLLQSIRVATRFKTRGTNVWGASVKQFRKTISLAMFVRLSIRLFVHIEQRDTRWMDFRKISYLKFVYTFRFRLKSDGNDILHIENYILSISPSFVFMIEALCSLWRAVWGYEPNSRMWSIIILLLTYSGNYSVCCNIEEAHFRFSRLQCFCHLSRI